MVSRYSPSDPDQRAFAATDADKSHLHAHAGRRLTTRSDSGHGDGGGDGDSWEAEPLALSPGGDLMASAGGADESDDTAAGAEVPLFRVPVGSVFAPAIPASESPAAAADEPPVDEPDDAEALRRLDPNRDLPIPHYAQLNIPEILTKVLRISPVDVVRIRDYEVATRNRKTLVDRLARIVRGDGRKRKKPHAHHSAN